MGKRRRRGIRSTLRERSGSKASSERYRVPTKVRVNLTNGSGKIKWQILVTCKICHLPFFPCRQALFLKNEFPGQRSGSKASSERYRVPTKVRVNLTNGRGKIKWQILVTCKICHLPFFPCRHTLFLQHQYSSNISCSILSGDGHEKFSGNVSGVKRCRRAETVSGGGDGIGRTAARWWCRCGCRSQWW